MRRLTVLVALLCLPAPATAAGASLRTDLDRLARAAGGATGFAVLDGRSGRRLAAVRADTVRPLGSATKLVTTAAALDGLPRELVTTASATTPVDGAGVVAGDLVLRGNADGTLGEAGLAVLADAVVGAGVREVRGAVVGDGTVLDAAIGGPATAFAYDPELAGALGGLTYDRGRAAPGGPVQPDPARAAAARLDDLLEARGVVIRGTPRAGALPPGAVALARWTTPVARIVKATNKPSDNLLAELLAKRLGGGTTAGGAKAAQAYARRLGARITVADGAGLVPGSRASALQLARFTSRVRTISALAASLPVAGRDGTLRARLRSAPARGRCRAKTGTLPSRRVSTLAGWCSVRGGGTRVFALLFDGAPPARARAAQDRMVQRLARR